MPEFQKILEPGKIGEMEVKNRLVYPPMGTRFFTEQGEITDRLINYYVARARGGLGLMVFESTYVRAGGYKGRVCLDEDRFIPLMKKFTDAVHNEGVKVVCEVNVHRGRADDHDPASPSNIPHPYSKVVPRALTIEEIKKLQSYVGPGVRRVKEAGFDGMMFHGGSGYLVSEFLSPVTNKRTDQYGGDIKNRARFSLELVEIARKTLGPDYPIIFRLMCDDRVPGNFGINDAVIVAKLLEAASVDAIDVTTGFAETDDWPTPVADKPRACNVEHSKSIKEAVKIPVIVTGKINNMHLAEQVLREGKADFVDMGRAFIADPQILKISLAGKDEDICPCICCSRCSEGINQPGGAMQCSVNAATGHEQEFEKGMKPAAKKKKVLVVGSGPGGAEAALRAAQRGHKVTLWEADKKLGGEINLAVMPPGKEDMAGLIPYYQTQLKKAGVAVELGKVADAEAVVKFAPDAVVVATGAMPFKAPIPGADQKHVVGYKDVFAGKKLGKKVVVIGGGLIGCETTEFLASKGKSLSMAFLEPDFLILFARLRRAMWRSLLKHNVKVLPGVKEFKRITERGVELVDKDGKEVFLEGDNIVLATGVKPNKTLAQSLKGKVPELYEVGDCVEACRILEAVHGGARAAITI